MAKVFVQPKYPPSGGHRGPMYIGDLYRVCKAAAYRADFRFVLSARGFQSGIPDHLCSLNNGDFDMYTLRDNDRPWIGPLGNIEFPMVPEWTVLDNHEDGESDIYALGWRLLLKRWLRRGIIKPTAEIRALIGPDFYRYMAAGALDT